MMDENQYAHDGAIYLAVDDDQDIDPCNRVSGNCEFRSAKCWQKEFDSLPACRSIMRQDGRQIHWEKAR